MAGAAWHGHGPAAGKGDGRSLDGPLKVRVHHGGRAGAETLKPDAAAAVRGDLRGPAPQRILQAMNDVRIIVANLKQHFRSPRDNARSAGIERDAARGPDGARPAESRESIVDIDAKPGKRHAGVLAGGHAGRTSVILLAGEADPILPYPDDGGDHADGETAGLEHLALLDMRLQITDMPSGFGTQAAPPSQTGIA